jgi:hypothetical protein
MAAVYHAQVMYLKLTGCPVGLLLNFNVTALRNGLRRLVRPDMYTKKEGSRAPVPHVKRRPWPREVALHTLKDCSSVPPTQEETEDQRDTLEVNTEGTRETGEFILKGLVV